MAIKVSERDLLDNLILNLQDSFEYYEDVLLEEEIEEILTKFLRENYVFTGLNAGILIIDENREIKTTFPPKYEGKPYSEVPPCVYLVDMLAILLKNVPGFTELILTKYLELKNKKDNEN